MPVDWGEDLPRLAEYLCRLRPGTTPPSLAALAEADQYRGLFGLCLRRNDAPEPNGRRWDDGLQRIWPEIRPVRPPPAGFWERMAGFLRNWLGLKGTSESAFPDAGEWLKTIVSCQVWIAGRNAAALAPLYVHFGKDLPIEQAVPSCKAIAWALAAYAFDKCGPEAFANGFPKFYAFTKDDLPGDLLSLHGFIEQILTSHPSCARLSGASVTRHLGGWRSAQFIQCYTALNKFRYEGQSISSNSKWLNALDGLIAFSPLTRLVYLDLVTPDVSIAEVTAMNLGAAASPFEPLLATGRVVTRSSTAVFPNLWHSQLARSLTDAVLSPLPCHEERIVADTEWRACQVRVEAERKSGMLGSNSAQRLQELSARVAHLAARERDQRVTRLATLCAIVAPDEQAFSTHWFLRERFLDMLMRHVTATLMGRMRNEAIRLWKADAEERKKAVESGSPPSEPSLDVEKVRAKLMYDKDSMLLKEFMTRLLGTPLDLDKVKKDYGAHDDSLEWLAARFIALLKTESSSRRNDACKAMREAMGLTDNEARDCFARFATQAIEVTFEQGDQKSYTPKQLLEAW